MNALPKRGTLLDPSCQHSSCPCNTPLLEWSLVPKGSCHEVKGSAPPWLGPRQDDVEASVAPSQTPLHLLSFLRVKARAVGNLTEQLAMEKQSGYLNLQRRASTNLIFPEGPLSPDLGLSFPSPFTSLPCMPLPGDPSQRLSPPSSQWRLQPPPTRGGAISTPDPSHARQTPLSLQQDAFSLGLRGVGVGGSLGQPQGLGILHIYRQDANPLAMVI